MTRKKPTKGEAMDWSGNFWWENTPPSLIGLGCNHVQSSVCIGCNQSGPRNLLRGGNKGYKKRKAKMGQGHSYSDLSTLMPQSVYCLLFTQ